MTHVDIPMDPHYKFNSALTTFHPVWEKFDIGVKLIPLPLELGFIVAELRIYEQAC